MTSSRPRRLLTGVWVMVPFAALLLTTTLWSPPERVPTHWSADLPDGFSTGAGVLSVALSVAGFCAVLAALVGMLSSFLSALWSRWILTVLAAVGSTAAAMYGAAAWGTTLAGGPERVHLSWSLAPFAVAALFATAAYLIHGRPTVDRQQVIDQVPERSRIVPVDPRQPLVPWATHLESGVLLGTAVFVAVVLTVTTVLSWVGTPVLGVVIGLLSLLTVLFVLAWSRVEARVDERGLTIRSTLLPVTLLRVAAGEVLGVQTAELDPMRWGGVGLRWLPERTAYIVRGGPGVIIYRASGRRFAVEISEGEEVAAAGARALQQAAGQVLASGRSS